MATFPAFLSPIWRAVQTVADSYSKASTTWNVPLEALCERDEYILRNLGLPTTLLMMAGDITLPDPGPGQRARVFLLNCPLGPSVVRTITVPIAPYLSLDRIYFVALGGATTGRIRIVDPNGIETFIGASKEDFEAAGDRVILRLDEDQWTPEFVGWSTPVELVQKVFTTNVANLPLPTKHAVVYAVGGGGGGSGGGRSNGTTPGAGGGGGGAGESAQWVLDGYQSISITIGAGGAGGAGISVANPNTEWGQFGGDTTVVGWVTSVSGHTFKVLGGRPGGEGQGVLLPCPKFCPGIAREVPEGRLGSEAAQFVLGSGGPGGYGLNNDTGIGYAGVSARQAYAPSEYGLSYFDSGTMTYYYAGQAGGHGGSPVPRLTPYVIESFGPPGRGANSGDANVAAPGFNGSPGQRPGSGGGGGAGGAARTGGARNDGGKGGAGAAGMVIVHVWR